MAATLETLTNLAKRQLEIESQLADLEQQTKEAAKALLQISETDIPELMDTLEVSEFKMADGRVISIKESVHAKIPEEYREAAFSYLRERGLDGVIKNNVIVSFGKGEDEEAEGLLQVLRSQEGLEDKVSQKQDIHHSTLKALVKEMLDEDDDGEFPRDTFGVFVRRASVITAVKPGKKRVPR